MWDGGVTHLLPCALIAAGVSMSGYAMLVADGIVQRA